MHLLKDENGNVIPHGHDHHHDGEGHGHHAAGEHAEAAENQDKTAIFLKYMITHNESHLSETLGMAKKLEEEGRADEAALVKEAAEYFMKGNEKLKEVLGHRQAH